jgi:hypothetical protein
MAESPLNPGKSPDLEEPSLMLRPGVRVRRERLLRDLAQPGWVVISHLGQATYSPLGPQKESSEAGETEESRDENINHSRQRRAFKTKRR